MTEDKQRMAEAGAYAIARRNVATAMARQGRPVDIENALTFLPTDAQIAAAPASAIKATAPAAPPAPAAPAAPAPAAPAAATWQGVIDKVNRKAGASGKPAASDDAPAPTAAAAAWARVIEAANARRRDG
ncbi:hypothetical protein ACK6D9_12205 [Hoeflea sp. Naph1]|uniref:hypothetical protein n=1 Tax=Hoeflea sp. Naph1 TaxID=3388653 RepID=UPI00398FADB5